MVKMQILHTLWSLRSYNAAYLSALSLVVIQVGIGCIMRASQTSGKYTFSTSSSVTISEFFKFLISSALIIRSSLRGRRDPAGTHELVPVEDGDERVDEKGRGMDESVGLEDERLIHPLSDARLNRRGGVVGDYLRSLGMVSVENRYGFAKLALLYALINNTVRTNA